MVLHQNSVPTGPTTSEGRGGGTEFEDGVITPVTLRTSATVKPTSDPTVLDVAFKVIVRERRNPGDPDAGG